MPDQEKKEPLLIYFIAVFILTIPLYALVALTSMQPDFTEEMAFPFVIMGAVIPIAVAVVLTLKGHGKAGLKDLFKRTFAFKGMKNKIWLVPTFLIFPIAFLAGAGVMILTGEPIPSAQFPLFAVPILFIVFFILAIGEEVGWMAYAFGPMEKKFGTNKATLLLGLIWAAWHIPFYIFMMGNFFPILFLPLALFGVHIVLVALYKKMGDSVLVTLLFHTMYNVTVAVIPNYNTSLGIALSGLFIFIAAFVLVKMGIKTSS